MDKYIGKIYKNNIGLKFKVIEKVGKDSHSTAIYTLEFLETKYRTQAKATDFTRGRVKDWYAKTIFNVACKGVTKTDCRDRKYRVWQNMLARCYYTKSNEYQRYGAKGVTVCNRWLTFEYFEQDISKIKGYDETLFYQNKIQLDKDMSGQKIYSLETCIFLTPKQNVQLIYNK